uniref:Uncharacterized protein n=1 Tax=Vombatus ursinus TaxID=29139 RepID=A0A4X2LX69_VOMUR
FGRQEEPHQLEAAVKTSSDEGYCDYTFCTFWYSPGAFKIMMCNVRKGTSRSSSLTTEASSLNGESH